MAEGADDVFPDYPVASFKVGNDEYAFPVVSIQESGGNRIIPRERPYRDGAKLDDTGSRPKEWTMMAIFNNNVALGEDGVSEVNGDQALYPDILNLLIGIFDVHETGTLVVPTIGGQRVRAESYNRVEQDDLRSTAMVQFTFLEDNEDDVAFRIITAPTANANAQRLAESTTFDAQSLGDWDQSFADLETFTADLQALANSPQDTFNDIVNTNERIKGTAKKTLQLSKQAGVPGRNLMITTNGNRTERKVNEEIAIAARLTNDARRGRPQIITIRVTRNTSLFAVSALTEQDVVDLMDINPTLDPLFIPAKTLVKIFANTGNIR
jgi:prophage DNA circulation protein